MIIHDFSNNCSLLNVFISALRNINDQVDSVRFRKNLERIGEVFAYEISKTFDYKIQSVNTPFSKKDINIPTHSVVVSSILRAGLPLHQGILNYFDNATSAFVTSYTNHAQRDNNHGDSIESYVSKVNIDNKILIIADPMLATGASMVAAYNAILKSKKKIDPVTIHFVVVVASPEGVDNLKKAIIGENIHLWVLSIDTHLNEKGYIIPGLGDAGDLAFGSFE